jgi:tight adherence protein C
MAAVTGAYRWTWFVVFAIASVIGYLIPDYVLDHLIKAREEEIRRGLPDLLDLLVVCLEAGLSLDQAMWRAVDEMRPSYLAIADEFGLAMLEVRAGRPRVQAWRSLGERNDLEAMHILVSILVQTDQFGTGISMTLRSHSETMRTRRRQFVEEEAAKTTVKLLFHSSSSYFRCCL